MVLPPNRNARPGVPHPPVPAAAAAAGPGQVRSRRCCENHPLRLPTARRRRPAVADPPSPTRRPRPAVPDPPSPTRRPRRPAGLEPGFVAAGVVGATPTATDLALVSGSHRGFEWYEMDCVARWAGCDVGLARSGLGDVLLYDDMRSLCVGLIEV